MVTVSPWEKTGISCLFQWGTVPERLASPPAPPAARRSRLGGRSAAGGEGLAAPEGNGVVGGGPPHPNPPPAATDVGLPYAGLGNTAEIHGVYNIILTEFILLKRRKPPALQCILVANDQRLGWTKLTSASCVSVFRQPGTWPVAVLGG